MSRKTEGLDDSEIFDPWGAFRQMRDTYLENAARAMVQVVNTEEYARASGAMLSSYLQLAEPLRSWMDKVAPHVLAQCGLPSRKELLSVASRMNSIEMRLDDIGAVLEEIRQALRETQDSDWKAA